MTNCNRRSRWSRTCDLRWTIYIMNEGEREREESQEAIRRSWRSNWIKLSQVTCRNVGWGTVKNGRTGQRNNSSSSSSLFIFFNGSAWLEFCTCKWIALLILLHFFVFFFFCFISQLIKLFLIGFVIPFLSLSLSNLLLLIRNYKVQIICVCYSPAN